MNRQTLARSFLVTGLALAPCCFAGADIVKCVGADGHVTLTDQPCQGGERSVALLAGGEAGNAPAAAPTVASTLRTARERLSAGGLRRLDPPSRSLARDVATLKAARRAMQLMDSAAASLRARRIALH